VDSLGTSKLTPHHQGRPALPETPAKTLFRGLDLAESHDRQSLGRGGTARSTEGSMKFPVALGWEAATSLPPRKEWNCSIELSDKEDNGQRMIRAV
jgi:hypothetical protein